MPLDGVLLTLHGAMEVEDIIEIPNLWQRSRQYIYYLVKKYVWGVKRPTNPVFLPCWINLSSGSEKQTYPPLRS